MSDLAPENVQSYPRPPALEPVPQRLRVIVAGQEVAATENGWRVLETHHAPTYYFPPQDVQTALFSPAGGRSFCEWKGAAQYWSVTVDGHTRDAVAWSYANPTGQFGPIAGYFAFYVGKIDAAFVGETRVLAQPGSFYGGWVTPNLTGTIKGGPGTEGW